MKAELLGKLEIDFTPDKGERIVGTRIHIGFESDNPNFEGMETVSYFIKPEKIALPDGLKVGSVINISFNRKGKPEKITLSKA